MTNDFPERRDFLKISLTAALGIWAAGGSLWGKTASAKDKLYRVQKGDTLSEIARDHHTTVTALKATNRLTSDRIIVGQSLIIPGSVFTGPMGPVLEATTPLRISRNRWTYVVAHHSAIERGNAAAYDAGHRRRGMENGLAYHFVIGNGLDSGDGEIEVGPRWYKQLRGGHVRSSQVNDTGIGICLVGNFMNHRPTSRQMASFTALVDYLKKEVVSSRCKYTVHKWVDLNHTVCPGKYFPYSTFTKRYS